MPAGYYSIKPKSLAYVLRVLVFINILLFNDYNPLSFINPFTKPLAICVSVPNLPFYVLACSILIQIVFKRLFLCSMIQFECSVGFGWKVFFFVFSCFSCLYLTRKEYSENRVNPFYLIAPHATNNGRNLFVFSNRRFAL